MKMMTLASVNAPAPAPYTPPPAKSVPPRWQQMSALEAPESEHGGAMVYIER